MRGLAASSGMSSRRSGWRSECECRTHSGANTLAGAFGDHERHVIVESAAGPLRQLAQCGLGKLFCRRVLDVGQPARHAVAVEELAGAIACLQDAIRIEQETIAGGKGATSVLVYSASGKKPSIKP